jgi:alkanesulfonate monooxygenase SsuD/methylene tetrahydromethanopterin reductase-like flavin-dependent oxidoreductase (luciferase family)
VRHGVILIQDEPVAELLARARELEAAGVGTIWLADHLEGEPRFRDSWTLLGALAGQTSRARIGPLVSPMTFRAAAVLARAGDTLDELSDGRAELGVGAGGRPGDHVLADVEQWPPRERARRLAAWVPRIAELQQRAVPLTIGGQGPTALRLAARHAARWNTYGAQPDFLERTRERSERLDALLAEAGREPSSLIRSLLVQPGGAEQPFASVEALRDLEGRAAAAGIDELVLYWPAERWYGDGGGAPAVLAEIASRS